MIINKIKKKKKRKKLVCLEVITISDNPTSPPIRKMYTCYLPSNLKENSPPPSQFKNWKEEDTGKAKEFFFPIYKYSYKDDPAIHRTYSDPYSYMLFKHCKHFIPKSLQ